MCSLMSLMCFGKDAVRSPRLAAVTIPVSNEKVCSCSKWTFRFSGVVALRPSKRGPFESLEGCDCGGFISMEPAPRRGKSKAFVGKFRNLIRAMSQTWTADEYTSTRSSFP